MIILIVSNKLLNVFLVAVPHVHWSACSVAAKCLSGFVYPSVCVPQIQSFFGACVVSLLRLVRASKSFSRCDGALLDLACVGETRLCTRISSATVSSCGAEFTHRLRVCLCVTASPLVSRNDLPSTRCCVGMHCICITHDAASSASSQTQ